jgi:hypothetical protein
MAIISDDHKWCPYYKPYELHLSECKWHSSSDENDDWQSNLSVESLKNVSHNEGLLSIT